MLNQNVAAPALPNPAEERSMGWGVILGSRYTPPVFITLILLVGNLSFGILEGWDKTLLAIVVSIAVELVLGKLFTGKFPHPASAYISGISVGILVRSPAFWPYALCSAISITSKYAIRYKGRHIWNPSNLGIVAMLVLASDSVASLSVQWGNNVYPMIVIWCLGSIIIAKHKRFHICATYVLSFVAFAFLRSVFTGHAFLAEVAPITGPMYQLFTFFMVTDPKTTVKPRWAQCLVVFLVALAEAIMRLAEVVHAPYYALFMVGPMALLFELWWTSRKRQAAEQVTPAVA